MAIQVVHQFISLKGDGTDATQVQPSNWNATHSVTLASGQIMGRLSAGAGAVEEIPISSYMADLLASADAAALAAKIGLFTTGDVKYSLNGTAPAGWISLNVNTSAPTIGNAVSGANVRANADTYALFNLIYTNIGDTFAPVSGGRSGNPLTDFNAGKTITLPALAGRFPLGNTNFTMPWLGSQALGFQSGASTHTLTLAELPTGITSTGAISVNTSNSNNVTGTITTQLISGGSGAPFRGVVDGTQANATLTSNGTANLTSNNTAGQPHSIMPPYVCLTPMVKL